MDIKDGEYTVGVLVDGKAGDGRIITPTKLTAKGGAFTADVRWRLAGYDRMQVGGEDLISAGSAEYPVFTLTVPALGQDIPVKLVNSSDAELTEEHVLSFDPDTLVREQGNPFVFLFGGMVIICVLAAVIPAYIAKNKDKKAGNTKDSRKKK